METIKNNMEDNLVIVLDLGNYKKFRVSKKLISEEELKKFIDNPILKQPKKITRILSVFEDQY